MTVLMLAFSKKGYALMMRIADLWKNNDSDINIICRVKCQSLNNVPQVESVSECVGKWFGKADAIVFVGAVGIAVRSIAPFVKHKSSDSAVIAVDETGRFSVAVLSGHWGGGNELAGKIGNMIGAVPVITTATDREGRFAVDDFARKNNLILKNWERAKRISVDILEGREIGVFSDFEIKGEMPGELFYTEKSTCRIKITCYNESRGDALCLAPKAITLGIGCRKGVSEKDVEAAVLECLEENSINIDCVQSVASINIKKNEKGIADFAKMLKVPFVTYSAEELSKIDGDFNESDFVEQVTGVGSVCERSAAMEGRELLCRKGVYGKVTVAVGVRKVKLMW